MAMHSSPMPSSLDLSYSDQDTEMAQAGTTGQGPQSIVFNNGIDETTLAFIAGAVLLLYLVTKKGC